MTFAFDEFEITGRSRTHVTQYEAPRFAAHPEAAAAFLAMRAAAAHDGIDLAPFSTFRDYQTQLRIWNMKFTGRKPLYDLQGQERERATLSDQQVIDCILNWSALPGASRHHWGTEIDVVDAAAMPPGYAPRLLPQETAPGGVFHHLHCWLDAHIAQFGFFRPYQQAQGGMYPEPWHLSYAPLSVPALEQISVALLERVTREADIAGKELVLARLPAILERHVRNIALPDSLQESA